MIKINRLKEIKDIIEVMPPCYQIEILRRLSDDDSVQFSENNNGVFVNLTDLKPATIKILENYIKYFEDQQFQLQNIEKKKDIIKESFFKDTETNVFTKANKDVSTSKYRESHLHAE